MTNDAVPVTAEDREAAAEYMRRFPDLRLPEAFARHRLASLSQTPATPMDREAALVAAVRGALECLGRPDGYFPSIGAPKTRALQRAFEAYEPHPTFKGY